MLRIAINTTNLHVGGGVQVAASFFSELAGMDESRRIECLLSTEVYENVKNVLRDRRLSFSVNDMHGLGLSNRKVRKILSGYDIVFSVFGPLYIFRPKFVSVVGFAQPWIIYPNNECMMVLPLHKKIIKKIKLKIQSFFFSRSDIIVVEANHVKEGIVRELGFPAERIHVIPNCLSSIFREEDNRESIDFPLVLSDLKIGFLGRNYTHKNTSIFPEIAARLEEEYGIHAKFIVTFTEEEWNNCSVQFKEVAINIGPLRVSQCPAFYEFVDCVIFPSLLECFSATPLEAMAMEKPIIASDRPFNRDICGEYAWYFDPLEPEMAAEIIKQLHESGGVDQVKLAQAKTHALNFSTPEGRARSYCDLLMAIGSDK
jgi:glycosyltransferase involved in cell wall biosynthesis